jgi:DNA primase large subunit
VAGSTVSVGRRHCARRRMESVNLDWRNAADLKGYVRVTSEKVFQVTQVKRVESLENNVSSIVRQQVPSRSSNVLS